MSPVIDAANPTDTAVAAILTTEGGPPALVTFPTALISTFCVPLFTLSGTMALDTMESYIETQESDEP